MFLKLLARSRPSVLSIDKALDQCLKSLHREYAGACDLARNSGGDLANLRAIQQATYQIAETGWGIAELRRQAPGSERETLAESLQSLTAKVEQAVQAEPWHHGAARRLLGETLNHLIATQGSFAALIRPPATARPASGTRRVVITSDQLYQAHATLFPAERMLVAAGRRNSDTVRLGAVFEVTGDQNPVHVQADPRRLARALIAMELSGTHLACWLHSHPGQGPQATRPSSIDTKQHADWIRDYSPALISAILVEDRWVRFWGTALETGRVQLEMAGTGILKEHDNEHLYRLAE